MQTVWEMRTPDRDRRLAALPAFELGALAEVLGPLMDLERGLDRLRRMIGDLPDCRVLCVYLRGECQESLSTLPARGERFHVRLATLRPTSEARGMRRARELSQQIVRTLAALEEGHFQARGGAVRSAVQ